MHMVSSSAFFKPKHWLDHLDTYLLSHLKKYFQDQSIQETFYFTLKIEALVSRPQAH